MSHQVGREEFSKLLSEFNQGLNSKSWGPHGPQLWLYWDNSQILVSVPLHLHFLEQNHCTWLNVRLVFALKLDSPISSWVSKVGLTFLQWWRKNRGNPWDFCSSQPECFRFPPRFYFIQSSPEWPGSSSPCSMAEPVVVQVRAGVGDQAGANLLGPFIPSWCSPGSADRKYLHRTFPSTNMIQPPMPKHCAGFESVKW